MNKKRSILGVVVFYLILLFVCSSAQSAQEKDVKGGRDHPLVTRMPHFYIGQYGINEFDYENFKTNDGKVKVEGRKYVIDYRLKSGAKPPGKIQILRNYLNALKGIGAETMLKGSYYYVFRIAKGNMETWVKVDPGNYDGNRYLLTIVERKLMKQEVDADAAAMADGINASGHVAIYGIYFDSGKAVIKRKSDKSLKEIAKLLKQNPSLKLFVVGHTDSDGQLDYNMGLSNRRAGAVVERLTGKYGISKKRLDPKGLGPLAPVASNRSPAGKAKNRRVELVEKMN